jgi:hypothetical protein
MTVRRPGSERYHEFFEASVVGNPRIDLDEPVGAFDPKDISTSFFAAVITGRLREAMETGARAARRHQLSGVFAPHGA